jgi:hypothetical protein
VLNSAATLALRITFDVFSWGDTNLQVHRKRPNVDVRTFLDYFYGYVAAR